MENLQINSIFTQCDVPDSLVIYFNILHIVYTKQIRNRSSVKSKHLPWEICTSATKRSLRGNLCGMTARSAMAFMMSFQWAANSSGRSRFRTASDGTVRMMLSNSNSAQGEGAVRSSDHSAAVVTPEKNKKTCVQA